MLPELTYRFRRDAGLAQLPPPPPPPPPAPPEAIEPCRCGCVALRVRNAHLADKVRRLEAVLSSTGGVIFDDEADQKRAAERNWPAWIAAEGLGPEPAAP
jgi:hypothetical protein